MVRYASMLTWVTVGNGHIALRGRPGKRFFESVPDMNISRIITLLSEREGAAMIGQWVVDHDIHWTWLPLENGQYPQGEGHKMLKKNLPVISNYLDSGESIMIHCAAGIHRTGMLTYGLLRYRGYTVESARQAIGAMRDHTRHGMHDKHFQWGDAVILEY